MQDNFDFEQIEKLKIPFVQRLGKFAAACMNKRCNGTIYFGVADDKSGKYKHGEIVGIPITAGERDVDNIISSASSKWIVPS